MLRALFLFAFVCLQFVHAQDRNRAQIFAELYGDEVALPSGYESVQGLTGQELLKALHQISGHNFSGSEYKVAKQRMYDEVDNFDGMVRTVYSGLSFPREGYRYVEVGDQDGDGTADDFVNCEHVWPQSKFDKLEPMVSDLHHLYPALSVPNRMRSDLPFGVVSEKPEYETMAGSRLGYGEFEPSDADKGNIARAMFYFYTRYYDQEIFLKTNAHEFWDSRLSQLLQWHAADPVDEWERTRNERISTIQGNRNPFIDAPELAERIGNAFLSGAGRLGSR